MDSTGSDEDVVNKESGFEIDSCKSISEKESELISLIIVNQDFNKCESALVSQSEDFSSLKKSCEEVIEVNCKDIHVDVDSAVPVNSNCELPSVPHTMIGFFNENVDNNQDMASVEFHVADAAWISLLDKFEYDIGEDRIRGYIDGEKEFLCLWESFQSSTMSTFCVRSSDRFYKDANKSDETAVGGRVLKGAPRWSRLPSVPFDGIPFVMIDRKYFGCRLGGVERHNKKKGQFKTSRNGQSIKVGCTADAEVLEVWRVPSLSLSDQVKSREKRRLKKKLLGEVYDYISMDKYCRRYYVTLPLITKHQNHPILDPDAGKFKLLHPMVIEKIYELVSQGIYDKKVVRYMLHEIVREYQKELSIEIQSTDRSFYPTDRDIGNHIRNAKSALKKSELVSTFEVMDESNLQEVHEVCVSGTLNYSVDLQNNFCSTTNENDGLTYGITQTEPEILYENTNVSSGDCTAITDCDNGFNGSSVDCKTTVRTVDGNCVSIEDIVQSIDFYKCGSTSVEVDNITLILDQSNKRTKNQKLSQKPSKFSRNQENIQGLLKDEIRKTLRIINRRLDEEDDESKLKQILKQAKRLQRYIKGEQINRSREKKNGIQGMVNFNSVCDTSWLNN